jgi:hypothetical protein
MSVENSVIEALADEWEAEAAALEDARDLVLAYFEAALDTADAQVIATVINILEDKATDLRALLL